MKKILSLSCMAIAIVVALTSCLKNPTNDQYVGDAKTFTYSPSLKSVTRATVNPSTNVATLFINDGSAVNLDCLTPNQGGDALIMECPIIPLGWIWSQSNSQYVADGFAYNVKFGFTNNSATVWFVEKSLYGNYTLKNKSVGWGTHPNPGEWTSSFRGLSGISSITMPLKGRIGFGGSPDIYFFSF